ncbi:phenazine-specific anthranilate synthase component I [Streptomyces sp. p1417]|uniref:anthranilate synthase n=1 Tax=Streptomyces typhae TaxID=2681492 RepID=A0A6L6X1U6_9ACTN|nr:chorismate-binding protein [Streptomyces typhae]MVO87795.1 phenazine-specific anthranilate synthase component I [Streptomyces typhae]
MTGAQGTDPLGRVLSADPGPCALLYRPGSRARGLVDVVLGEVSECASLAELPLPRTPARPGAHHEVLAVVPFRQIAERGFTCVDDGAPLLALTVREQAAVPLAEVLRRVQDTGIRLLGGDFDLPDDAYADIVERVVADEIGTGLGANFVIRRSFVTEIGDYGLHSALSFFRRLLERESSAYWIFLIHTGDRTFVGASPERHVSLHGGTAVMNPISGTYRYPDGGPTLPGVLDFLADRKETDELYMVVDEELKMMSRVCSDGVAVDGPYLREMSRLAHTEYFIEGHTHREPQDILRETLFAPTVTGSPLESACRVIARYEPQGRGYYSGVAALIGRDEWGGRTLDSAILIRTADIDRAGRVAIGVGATLVRHSRPVAEVAETRTKATGLIAALEGRASAGFRDHPEVRAALRSRNDALAGFWLADGEVPQMPPDVPRDRLAGLRVLVIDAEDTFTSMIELQLRSMGMEVTARRFDEQYTFTGHDVVVMGPGPGDPCATSDPKIAHLEGAIRALLNGRRPFLAVCLSHQVLSRLLGLGVVRKEVPNQGLQREIDLFGSREQVGFYNTFVAHSTRDVVEGPHAARVEISRDRRTGEVHALRSPHFASMQFHAESVLTHNGPRIVAGLLAGLAPVGGPEPTDRTAPPAAVVAADGARTKEV